MARARLHLGPYHLPFHFGLLSGKHLHGNKAQVLKRILFAQHIAPARLQVFEHKNAMSVGGGFFNPSTWASPFPHTIPPHPAPLSH